MAISTPSPTAAAMLFLTASIVSILLGFTLGKRARSKIEPEASAPIAAVVAATLGLLAFTLGFTFNIAAARFDLRRSLVIEEANSLQTLSLRAGLLPGGLSASYNDHIKEYLANRIEAAEHPEPLRQAEAKAESLLEALWQPVPQAAIQMPDSEVLALFIETLNGVIDLNLTRVNIAVYRRIPPPIWLMLMFVTSLSMVAVGYQFGLVGSLNLIVSTILVLSFTAVISLIADLDHPYKGTLRVSQQPLIEVLENLERSERGARSR